MYKVTRYENELILAFKEQLAVLKSIDYLTEEQRAQNIDKLTDSFIADMTNAI